MRRVRWVALALALALATCAVPPQATPGSVRPLLVPDRAPEPVVVAPAVEAAERPRHESALPALVAATPFDDTLPAEPEARRHPPRPWPFDVRHYEIHVLPKFASRSLDGVVAITLRARRDGLTEVPLDAAGLRILDVTGPGDQALFFEHTEGRLVVQTGSALPTDSDTRLVIRYEGTPTRGMYFNLPSAADPEAPRQCYTQGECEDTRYWLPCHDFPDDRATHELHVTVPEGMEVVGAGERTGVTSEEAGYATWSFRMDVPHVAYLITLVAGDYVRIDHDGVVPLEYVVEERDAPHAAHSLRETDAILRFFGDYTGRAYPYARYAQSCVRDFRFGGMENISATTLTDRTIHPADWEPAKRSTGLVAHEAAHQWFGDLITCRHWKHVWLNEGFATYFELLYREHAEGRDAFLAGLRRARNSGLGAFDGEKRPVVTDEYADPFDLFDGHAYGGGAARLHMLRALLGDETFREVIRTWVRTAAGRVAVTRDFQEVVAQVAGRDLDWWFEQWLRGPGYPKLRIRSKWLPEKGALRLSVQQTQKVAGGVPAAFRLPLDVAFDLPSGETVVKTLSVADRKQTFTIPLPVPPAAVRPDPETSLLARYDLARSVAEWSHCALADPNPAWRMVAAEELRKALVDGKRPDDVRQQAATGLGAALVREPLAVVREVQVKALARSGDATQRTAVALLAVHDDDLRVRLAATEGLGEHDGDEGSAETLRSLVHSDNDLIRARALRSLAKIKATGAGDVLRGELSNPGWQQHVRVAALESFGDVGGEQDWFLLKDFARPIHDAATRQAALKSLGRLGKERPDFRDAVLPHLSDPNHRIRSEAAKALGAIGDPDAIPSLVDAFGRERWRGTRKDLRKAIQACRKRAVESGKLVTTGAVRAAELRARHAALGKEFEALGDGARERAKAIHTEQRTIRKELRALGVGLPAK